MKNWRKITSKFKGAKEVIKPIILVITIVLFFASLFVANEKHNSGTIMISDVCMIFFLGCVAYLLSGDEK